ncbi:Hypothetical_protein [Hexamita inflata]|uniref:Hypothetical_protein n=1 Tax=Hexamita inflata TaxID=28002 RepID=A0AA86UPQ4_9EUKA|nr:Hypothetical protein HINF_LOCUS47266 [Hexamita inflata]
MSCRCGASDEYEAETSQEWNNLKDLFDPEVPLEKIEEVFNYGGEVNTPDKDMHPTLIHIFTQIYDNTFASLKELDEQIKKGLILPPPKKSKVVDLQPIACSETDEKPKKKKKDKLMEQAPSEIGTTKTSLEELNEPAFTPAILNQHIAQKQHDLQPSKLEESLKPDQIQVTHIREQESVQMYEPGPVPVSLLLTQKPAKDEPEIIEVIEIPQKADISQKISEDKLTAEHLTQHITEVNELKILKQESKPESKTEKQKTDSPKTQIQEQIKQVPKQEEKIVTNPTPLQIEVENLSVHIEEKKQRRMSQRLLPEQIADSFKENERILPETAREQPPLRTIEAQKSKSEQQNTLMLSQGSEIQKEQNTNQNLEQKEQIDNKVYLESQIQQHEKLWGQPDLIGKSLIDSQEIGVQVDEMEFSIVSQLAQSHTALNQGQQQTENKKESKAKERQYGAFELELLHMLEPFDWLKQTPVEKDERKTLTIKKVEERLIGVVQKRIIFNIFAQKELIKYNEELKTIDFDGVKIQMGKGFRQQKEDLQKMLK